MTTENTLPVTVDLAQEQSHQQILRSENPLKRFVTQQFVIEHHHHRAHEIQLCSVVQAGVVINLGGAYSVDQWIDGKFRHNQFEQGDFTVFPAEISHRAIWDRPIEFLMIGLEQSFVQQKTLEIIEPKRSGISVNASPEIIPRDKLKDSLIYQIGLNLKRELQISGSLNTLYAESAIDLLLVHLLRHYSSPSSALPEFTPGLPNLKLKQVIDYINENITQNISLQELATVARMSPHHFSRLFRQSIGLPPHQYIIHRRLAKAKELLKNFNLSITDIAEASGFASQSHLTTLFRKHLSVTPKKYREML